MTKLKITQMKKILNYRYDPNLKITQIKKLSRLKNYRVLQCERLPEHPRHPWHPGYPGVPFYQDGDGCDNQVSFIHVRMMMVTATQAMVADMTFGADLSPLWSVFPTFLPPGPQMLFWWTSPAESSSVLFDSNNQRR